MKNKEKKAILKEKKNKIKEKGYYSLVALETGLREDHYPILFGPNEIIVSLKATEEEIKLARERARKGEPPIL